MKIKCMLDDINYNQKPTGKEIGRVQNNCTVKEITIEELANKLSNGCSFRPAVLYGTKEKDWREQQIIAIDFDDGVTIENILNYCIKINLLPSFGYTSFSHTEEHHKFRLVFVLDEKIYELSVIKNILSYFKSKFPQSDKQTYNIGRLFFGGRSLIYKNYDNIIKVSDLLSLIELDNINTNVNTNPTNPNEIERFGVPNRTNKNILNLLGTPKHQNIELLKNRDINRLKEVLNIDNQSIIFETQQQFFDFISKIELPKLLGIEHYRNFNCIFHDDKNPSANIFKDKKTGHWIYKCSSSICGVSYNIIGIIERLCKFNSRPKTYKFIKSLFNLEIMDTEWQREQKEILIENLKIIHNGELENNCPQAYKNNKKILRYLEQLHYIALDNIYDKKYSDSDGNVIFFASRSYIAGKLGLSEYSTGKVSNKLAVLSYHDLINKLPDSDINDSLLKDSLLISFHKNNKYKRINYFSIPSYTYNLYPKIEEQGIKWKENNYSMKGVSREMFYRKEGEEVANKLYPQYSTITAKNGLVEKRGTSISSDEITIDIVKFISNEIYRDGYVTEKQIIKGLNYIYNENILDMQIKKSLPEILEIYSLNKVRCTKELKEKYKITGYKGYPNIIVEDKDE